MRRALVLAILAMPTTALAEPEVSALGSARAIPRASSASRDTPAMNLVVVPRDIRTAGAELAMLTARFDRYTLRAGFGGMIELESDGETTGFGNVFPSAEGAILWRGAYAWYAAVSFDDLAAGLCDGCRLEVTGAYRHESQHYSGSNFGGGGMDVTDEPYVGDCFIVDVAFARSSPVVYASGRLVGRGYLPGRSSYSAAAALDLHARWLGFGRWQPFLSGWAERQRGTELEARWFPGAYLLRAMAGVAITSRLGEILAYGFADVGHRKGVRILSEEATLGFGVRLAIP